VLQFGDILQLPEGPAKTAALAEWVQGLYSPDCDPPVLVGGAAVELLTDGAYSTGDLDFAGSVPEQVALRLKEEGFERQGRHWVHQAGEIFLEFPASELASPETSLTMQIAGSTLEILSPEAVLADRLSAWEFWDLDQDGINAFLVWRAAYETLNKKRLEALIEDRRLNEAWKRFSRFAERHLNTEPTPEELSRWASKQDL